MRLAFVPLPDFQFISATTKAASGKVTKAIVQALKLAEVIWPSGTNDSQMDQFGDLDAMP